MSGIEVYPAMRTPDGGFDQPYECMIHGEVTVGVIKFENPKGGGNAWLCMTCLHEGVKQMDLVLRRGGGG